MLGSGTREQTRLRILERIEASQQLDQLIAPGDDIEYVIRAFARDVMPQINDQLST